MQAVADHRHCFTDINMGQCMVVLFSKIHNYMKELVKEHFYRLTVAKSLIILGDSAYPLSKWLIKPYSDTGHLISLTKDFNYRLSRAQIVIQNAFGRLKGRQRCLLKCNDTDHHYLPNVIAMCATFHNIHREHFNKKWYTSSDHTSVDNGVHSSTASSETNATVEAIRSALKDYVLLHPL